MRLTITTWNINSVRLRIEGVARFVKAVRPDVLCLQETKCPDDKFPIKRFKRLGYEYVALNGQKGYHGVVVLSSVRKLRCPVVLREERLPAHLGRARRTRGTS
jgi:exodeoxyribonuclease-3